MISEEDIMIKQEILVDGVIILTIFHDKWGDEDFIEKVIEEEISDKTVLFKEYNVLSFDENDFEYDYCIKGFLNTNNDKNPYNLLSTNYIEYIKNIDFYMDDFISLVNFVKEYTGYVITNESIGNVLFFSPIKIEVSSISSNNISTLNIKCNLENISIIILFKLNNIIIETKFINNCTISGNLEIYPSYDWNNYEIEIFEEDTLLFKDDAYITTQIQISNTIVTKLSKEKLATVDKEVLISDGVNEKFKLEYNNNFNYLSNHIYKESMNRYFIKKYITNNEDVIFLRNNDRTRAFDIIEELIKNEDEIWIFDPYFMSLEPEGGFNNLMDILKILLVNTSNKNIVFYEKDNQESFEDINSRIINNNLHNFLINLGTSKIKFIKAKEHFHDRFFFFKKGDNIKGYLLGSSLNSFGTNYSTLVKLDDFYANNIFKILKEEIVSDISYCLGD